MTDDQNALRSAQSAGVVDLSTLRQVARALTADANSRDILRTLCEAATIQGYANGAAVAQIGPDSGEFVAGYGTGFGLVGTQRRIFESRN